MATTVRLTANRRENAPRPVLIGAGSFGERVVDLLSTALPGSSQSSLADLERVFATGREPVVVTLWRPTPAICARADDLAYLHGRTWLPVISEHPVLRIGPLVTPPWEPCFGCYRARRQQHAGEHSAAAAATLDATYDRDPGFGPAGFLPHHARLAAGVAEQFLRAATMMPAVDRPSGSGEVVTVDLVTSRLTTGRVVPCHDCSRHAAADARSPSLDLSVIAKRLSRGRTSNIQTRHVQGATG